MQSNFVYRRWAGLVLAIGIMCIGAILFTAGFEHLSVSLHFQVILAIFEGPFGWDAYYQTRITRMGQLFMPLLSAGLLLAHPIKPGYVTMGLTLTGGFLWWVMGWWTIASGI